MQIRLLAALAALAFFLFALPAQARAHRHYNHVRVAHAPAPSATGCTIMIFDNDGRTRCGGAMPQFSSVTRTPSPRHYAARGRLHRGAYVRRDVTPNNAPSPALRGIGASLAGLPGELIAKIEEIAGACPGFRAISTFRPGARVAGTNIPSLHGFHKAADIAGPNYACAYAHLQGWPGGVSTDAARMAHIHLSWAPGSREFGARFVHGGGGHGHRARHAQHRRARWRSG
jgi:hypothetical protein